jgi:hypothetical protein
MLRKLLFLTIALSAACEPEPQDHETNSGVDENASAAEEESMAQALQATDCRGPKISTQATVPYKNWWDDVFGGKKYREQANTAAFNAWRQQALAHGSQFGSWENAGEKYNNCYYQEFQGKWVCTYSGFPCACLTPCTIGSYDGNACYVATPPAGTNPVIWQGGLYYSPVYTPTCPLNGSQYDGANCQVATAPPGTNPFVWGGGLYHTALPGGVCPLPGSYFDGNACFVAMPPAGTKPVIWQRGLYHSPVYAPTCPLNGSQYDGANCQVATAPPGTSPFVWQGSLYYSAICKPI